MTPDPFDALLDGGDAPSPATEAPAPAPHVLVEPGHSPTFGDFREGWPLFQDPVLCAILAGIGLAAPGVFIVLRRAVFVTAAVSQAAGLGVALAFYVQIHLGFELSPVLGALLASVGATLLAGVKPSRRIARETVVGFVFVAASAIAVLLGDRIAQEAHDVAAILFGSAVLVRPLDFWLVLGVTIATLATLLVLGRALTFTGFDPDGAKVQGLPVRWLEAGFWALFAIEVSVTTRALGALPVFAFAVLPAAAGLLLANRVRTAIAIAVVLGGLSGGAGYLLAFVNELPVGACQATTASVLAGLSYLGARWRSR
jgi:zinc transport system permease protein